MNTNTEKLYQEVKQAVDDCQVYIDSQVLNRIKENYSYYNREAPASVVGESTYIDNTCQATVNHALATCLDAFSEMDSFEVVSEVGDNPAVLKVTSKVVADVLNTNRHTIFNTFFQDALVSGAGIFKTVVREDTVISSEFFTNLSDIELAIFTETLTKTINKETTEIIGKFEQDPLTGLFSGRLETHKRVKIVEVENVPAEAFLINQSATCVSDATFIGHRALVSIGDLVDMGIDESTIEAIKDYGSNYAYNNGFRNEKLIGTTLQNDTDDDIELYEVYIKTTLEEIEAAKMYKCFYVEGYDELIDVVEVDDHPYRGASPFPMPFSFWGNGLVDLTKHIQRAKTGLMRDTFAANAISVKPRFQYDPSQLHKPEQLFNTQAGAGVAVKSLNNAIAPLNTFNAPTIKSELLGTLDQQRESGTGVSFSGQGILGDVLKAGGSTISASMVLTESQLLQKYIISSLLENGIKPLIKLVYDTIKENIDEVDVVIDGQKMTINPSKEWLPLQDIRVKAPLGKSAKLEKANVYQTLYQQLMATPELTTPDKMARLLSQSYELQGIDAKAFMNSPQEIQQNHQQQMMQMQQQLQQLTQENEQLKAMSGEVVRKEIELREKDLEIKQAKAEYDLMASESKLDLERAKFTAGNSIDKKKVRIDEFKAETDAEYKKAQAAIKENAVEAKFDTEVPDTDVRMPSTDINIDTGI